MKYLVQAKLTSYPSIYVEASSEEEALRKAEEIDGGEFDTDHDGTWEIYSATPTEKLSSKELITNFMGEKAMYNIISDVDPNGYYQDEKDFIDTAMAESFDFILPVVAEVKNRLKKLFTEKETGQDFHLDFESEVNIIEDACLANRPMDILEVVVGLIEYYNQQQQNS